MICCQTQSFNFVKGYYCLFALTKYCKIILLPRKIYIYIYNFGTEEVKYLRHLYYYYDFAKLPKFYKFITSMLQMSTGKHMPEFMIPISI